MIKETVAASILLRPASVSGFLDFAPYKIQRLYNQGTRATVGDTSITQIPGNNHGSHVRVDVANSRAATLQEDHSS